LSNLFSPSGKKLNPRVLSAANGWRLEILYIAAASVELLWWLPWLLFLVPGAASVSDMRIELWTAINFFGALLVTRILSRRKVDDILLRGIYLIGVTLALGVTFNNMLPINLTSNQPPAFANGKLFFPSPILTTLLVLWFWYRGQTLATSTVTPARAGFGFRIGIVALIGAALITDSRSQHMELTVLPIFFFAGLSTNSLARASSLRISRDVQRSPFGSGWVGFIVLIGMTLSAVGFVGGIILGGVKFDTALGVVHDIFTGILSLVAVLLLPIAQFFAGLIDSFMGRVQVPIGQIVSVNTQFGDLARNAGPPSVTAMLMLNVAPFICGGGGLLLILILTFLMLRRQSHRVGQNGEERETLDNAAILSSLRAAGRQAIDNMLDGITNMGFRPGTNYFTIRRLYARLCRLAGERGYPRGSAQTPDEYRLVLNEAFPTFSNEIDQLTRSYVTVHYGEGPEDLAIIATARALCDQIAAQQPS